MPDNFTASPASGPGGAVFAADDIAGVMVPRVKLQHGVDGVAVDASGTDPLPVSSATQQTHDAAAGAGPIGLLMLAVRRDEATSPVSANGDYSYLVTNDEGRLKTAGAAAQFAAVTGDIVAVAGTVSADVSQASNLMIYCTGVFAGVNCVFEGSIDGGTNPTAWFGIQAVRSNANTIELTTGVLAAAPAYAWELSVNALSHFRVRCTARTSGTQAWRFSLGSYATEPIPAAQISGTQPVSGTVTATVVGGTVVGTLPTASIINSAATTNGTVVKATAGTLYSIVVSNTGAAVAFLKLHNSATVVVGTTAVAMTIPIPAGAVLDIGYGPQGMRYGTGICLSITNLAADADTTAVTLGQVKVNTAFI